MAGTSRLGSVPKCSLSKYGFRASGVRTRASVDRAELGLLPGFLSSVLNRPSQEVRRERASGDRFSPVSAPGQSTGLPGKPQEPCHSARRPGRRRTRLVWELAEEVHPDSNRLRRSVSSLHAAGDKHDPLDRLRSERFQQAAKPRTQALRHSDGLQLYRHLASTINKNSKVSSRSLMASEFNRFRASNLLIRR